MTQSKVYYSVQRALGVSVHEGVGPAVAVYPVTPSAISWMTASMVSTSVIETARETTHLHRLVADTREKMRREKLAAASFPIVSVGSNATIVPGSADSTYNWYHVDTEPKIDLSRADSAHCARKTSSVEERSDECRKAVALAEATETAVRAQGVAQIPNKSPGATPVDQAPVTRLHDFAKLVLPRDAYERYVEPHLADIWLEYNRALAAGDSKGARRIVIRGYFEVVEPFLYGVVRSAVKAWLEFCP